MFFIMMQEVLQVGIFGFGRMGKNHLQAVYQCKQDVELRAIGDQDITSYESYVKENPSFSSVNFYESLPSMLENESIDIIIVATTSTDRHALIKCAIDHKVRYVLAEKPCSTSLESARELVYLSQSSENLHVAVNHQMRFLPQYKIPKSLLASEEYGGLRSMNITAGNFGLAMNGTHYFEAFRFLTDEAPVEVSAWFDTSSLPNPRGPQFSDAAGCIRLTTASGKRLYIDASGDQGHGIQVTYMAKNGRITVDELTGAMTSVVRCKEHRDANTNRYGMPAEIKNQNIAPVELVESTKAVLQALLNGEGYPTLSEATLAIKTLVAAYHSSRQGGNPIRLCDIADDDSEVFPWA